MKKKIEMTMMEKESPLVLVKRQMEAKGYGKVDIKGGRLTSGRIEIEEERKRAVLTFRGSLLREAVIFFLMREGIEREDARRASTTVKTYWDVLIVCQVFGIRATYSSLLCSVWVGNYMTISDIEKGVCLVSVSNVPWVTVMDMVSSSLNAERKNG